MKKIILPILAITFLLSATLVFAQNKPETLPKEISAEDKAMFDKHHETLTALYDKMWAKQMEYDALAQNPNTKASEVKTLVNEMAKLREEIRLQKTAFAKTMSAKGYGYGHGMGETSGYGMGYGHRGVGAAYDCPYYGKDKGHGYGNAGGHWRGSHHGGKRHHQR